MDLNHGRYWPLSSIVPKFSGKRFFTMVNQITKILKSQISSCLLVLNSDVYFPPCKKSRAPFLICHKLFKKSQTTINALPDECIFEILRRVTNGQSRSALASVSKRFLMLSSTIRRDEQKKAQDFDKSGGSLSRCLKGKKATDFRLAAISVSSGTRGGLGNLTVLESNTSNVTDFGLKAIAIGCPALTSLTICNLSSVTDEGVNKIANECQLLEKVELYRCSTISDKSLIAIANNCPNLTSLLISSYSNIGNEGLKAIGQKCLNLKSFTIKNCPLVGDQGIASLVSSASCSLIKIRLHDLNMELSDTMVCG